MPDNAPNMLPRRSAKTLVWGLLLLAVMLLAASLTLNVRSPFPYFYFFSDESTYYTMTLSLVHDRDLSFSRHDLERVCHDWEAGPTGIILKKTPGGEISFGKSYLYPLLAALPVRLFGINGFHVLNFLCFWLLVTLGALYLRTFETTLMGLMFSLCYFFFSVTWVFMFWIHPELVLMTLVMIGLFLWFMGPSVNRATEYVRLIMIALCLAMATFGKVTNAVFILPVALDLLLAGGNDRPVRPMFKTTELWRNVLKTTVFIMSAVMLILLLFLPNKLATGDWNYQWGERKWFERQFPFEDAATTFDNCGSPATREGLAIKTDPLLFLRNCYYFLFGRFTGLIAYFLPALIALGLFFKGPRNLKQVLLFGAFLILQGFYFIFLTDNYFGGSGTIGNRYFLNVFPLFLFLIPRRVPRVLIVLLVLVGSFFMVAINLNPYASSVQPAEHTFRFPYRCLPVELTQIDFLPVHINHHLSRRIYEKELPYRLTFLDFQTHLPENGGLWLRPGKAAEMLLETRAAASRIKVTLRNGARPNRVELKVDRGSERFELRANEEKVVVFGLKPAYVHNGWSIHPIRCRADNGFIPRFHEPDSTDKRYLGCFFIFELMD